MVIWSLNKKTSGKSAQPLNPCQKTLVLMQKNFGDLTRIGPSQEACWVLYLTLMQKNSDLTLIGHVKKLSGHIWSLCKKTFGICGSRQICP